MKSRYEIRDAYGDRIHVVFVDDPTRGLSGSNIEGLVAPCAKLPAMDFSGCSMYWAMLAGADLTFCNFSKADLSGANLRGANLRFANFQGACLSKDALGVAATVEDADLTGANLDDANLEGARYSPDTKFPDGFDVEGRGLVLVP